MKLNFLVVFAVIANVVFASPVSAQQANRISVMAICTTGVGACGNYFDETRPEDLKLVQKYMTCMDRTTDASAGDPSALCAAEVGIQFANTTGYHGPLVSVGDGALRTSKSTSGEHTSMASGGAQFSPQASVFFIPKGVPVVVRTTQSLHSSNGLTGSRIRFEVAQDAIFNGHVFAEAGDTAQGTVQEGQAGQSGFFGIAYQAANLRVSVDNVYNFCGDTVHIDFDRAEYRRRQGFFDENKDVTIIKGQQYIAFTDRPQKVCAEATNELPEPIPQDAIKTSDH